MTGPEKAATPVLNDLRERLVEAKARLDELADGINLSAGSRLRGKAQGVSLAISYVDEYLRGAHAIYTPTPDNTDSSVSP